MTPVFSGLKEPTLRSPGLDDEEKGLQVGGAAGAQELVLAGLIQKNCPNKGAHLSKRNTNKKKEAGELRQWRKRAGEAKTRPRTARRENRRTTPEARVEAGLLSYQKIFNGRWTVSPRDRERLIVTANRPKRPGFSRAAEYPNLIRESKHFRADRGATRPERRPMAGLVKISQGWGTKRPISGSAPRMGLSGIHGKGPGVERLKTLRLPLFTIGPRGKKNSARREPYRSGRRGEKVKRQSRLKIIFPGGDPTHRSSKYRVYTKRGSLRGGLQDACQI